MTVCCFDRENQWILYKYLAVLLIWLYNILPQKGDLRYWVYYPMANF